VPRLQRLGDAMTRLLRPLAWLLGATLGVAYVAAVSVLNLLASGLVVLALLTARSVLWLSWMLVPKDTIERASTRIAQRTLDENKPTLDDMRDLCREHGNAEALLHLETNQTRVVLMVPRGMRAEVMAEVARLVRHRALHYVKGTINTLELM